MTFAALILFEALRLALRVMLVVLVIHFVRAAIGALRWRRPRQPPDPELWPVVTVQLPLRNEFYVVHRVIRAVCSLDYPRDLLEIQVLDDSDDEAARRTREVVEALHAEGHPITVLHRARPLGYKAGALSEGLKHARGEVIALFDADCVPAPDFLRRTIPWLNDPRVGCVQARWSFLNRARSLLTRVQAIVLDGLFAADQATRAATGLPLQFNGTNGIWRRAAIDDAGGWNGDVLAEDADLSFRAQLRGWKLVHLADYAVPTEIPDDMAAFRSQQRRWALGSAQLLRNLTVPILRAPISARAKLMMFEHLGRHSIDPLLLMAVISSPFTTLYGMPFLVDYGVWLNVGLVVVIASACSLFYGVALRRVGVPRSHYLLIPLVIPLALGLSLMYTVAFLRGLVQRGGAFVRTPKAGDDDGLVGPTYRPPRDALAVLEVGVALAHLGFAAEAFGRRDWAYVCFFGGVSFSFGWVGVASLRSMLRRARRTGRA